MEISTEGVLILASAKGLANEYKDKEFNYSFPEGLADILDQHTAIALMTSDGDELRVEFEETDETPDKEIIRYIRLLPEDELLVLCHSDFTTICDNYNGDYTQYSRSVEKLENIAEGLYEVTIKVWNPKEIDEDEEEEEEWFFKLSVSMKPVTEAPEGNEVTEITD